MVLTDYIIEPMAGALDFWYWVGGKNSHSKLCWVVFCFINNS